MGKHCCCFLVRVTNYGSEALGAMKWLLENRVKGDIRRKHSDGRTPMALACSSNFWDFFLETMKWFFENGAKEDKDLYPNSR